MKLPQDWKEFLQLLNSRTVRYLLVGGHALAFYGLPRYTADIDFFLASDEENGRRVMDALSEFGFGQTGLSVEELAKPNKVIMMGVPPFRIDLLTSISGVEFEEAWSERVEGIIDGIPVTVISRTHLLQNKRSTGRLQDAADVERLNRTQ